MPLAMPLPLPLPLAFALVCPSASAPPFALPHFAKPNSLLPHLACAVADSCACAAPFAPNSRRRDWTEEHGYSREKARLLGSSRCRWRLHRFKGKTLWEGAETEANREERAETA